ncbi:uncharacterized protein MYCFIDRAFT_134295 [Pseudocercospora fijiensis CIRAD86]|uniref:AAA+ ATPase domain-containing protein n=1 Tax=Pseudocercospora fijiensis (strain CIRAD86) TaxID=383855 RepID=M3AHG5_PSEFD|nr:uncharacterized protein MYCFIDRAFT_134295 [Pseudocercospora fijiensis CIRAD86]EME84026.1 hypothetical protein MYCFIDRAFT_134295 [Pseudocercospora fijiensis CIRAD86]
MSASAATGLAITNPLVKYRALLATKAIASDPAQHRLAIQLAKLYDRLKDYEPELEYSHRLDQISRAIGSQRRITDPKQDAAASRQGTWRSWFATKEKRDSLALTRRLTSHESAVQMDSPKGLMLHGEVGTGKSMLIDLFADCLPNRKKKRSHFNTFMLETFAKLEALRVDRSRAGISSLPSALAFAEEDYSLLWLAKDMVQNSPILFLDEFQMPDRVASKILTNLMTGFFQLGGVLVATSNRMPEELAKAAGVGFAPAPQQPTWAYSLGLRRRGQSESKYGGYNEFAAFLEVLKARCEVWEMEGARDFRRMDSGSVAPVKDIDFNDADSGYVTASEASAPEDTSFTPTKMPKHYIITADPESTERETEASIREALDGQSIDTTAWSRAVMNVYGRVVEIPRAYKGVTMWTFEELCKATFGPADYISLASSYHTLILTEVPILTWLMKNEARRFITLLDALYESRCKLFISAAAGPDDIFFPEEEIQKSNEESDSVYSETLSEVYQDATAPFRPNILTQNPNYAEPHPEPDYTHARLADPDETTEIRGPADFTKTSAFTGEDERFAYKRAQSRLWEMCSARWWGREGEGWHRPTAREIRGWERVQGRDTCRAKDFVVPKGSTEVKMGGAIEDSSRPEESFKRVDGARLEPARKISWVHFWGMRKWGKGAGVWGRGVEGLEDRGGEKR